MVLRPTQSDEKRPLSSNHPPWKRHPPLCHLDRSVPRFPASRHLQQPRMRLSVEKGARSLPAPRSSTGNLGERSGEISVLTTSPGNVFRESMAQEVPAVSLPVLTHPRGPRMDLQLLLPIKHATRASNRTRAMGRAGDPRPVSRSERLDSEVKLGPARACGGGCPQVLPPTPICR